MDMCVEHQTYLGFSWRFNGVPRYFTFAVLPFGLSSACFYFHEIVIQKRELNSSGFLVNEDNPIEIPCKLANGWVS